MYKNLLTLLSVMFLSLSAHAQDPALILPSITVDESEEFELDITTENFVGLIAMQFTIDWDSSKAEVLEVLNFNLPDLDTTNFGLIASNTDRGWLPMLWEDESQVGIDREDGAILFTVKMRATGEPGDTIHFNFEGIPAAIEIVNANQDPIPVNLQNGEVILEDLVGIDNAINEPIKVNTYPNPFNEYTNINFDIKETTAITLIITDISGRQIYATEKTMDNGSHQLRIDASVFPSPGEYFYYVRTNEYQLFKKLIFVK